MFGIKKKPKLQELSSYALLSMYESEVKRAHYDPCDSYEREPFSLGQLHQELLRRLKFTEPDEDE